MAVDIAAGPKVSTQTRPYCLFYMVDQKALIYAAHLRNLKKHK